MCGVSHVFVEGQRPEQVETVTTLERTGQDGKQYPATREPANTGMRPAAPHMRAAGTAHAAQDAPVAKSKPVATVLGPPSNGMQFARMAIMDLEQIRPDDAERKQAFTFVKEWIDAREN
jgi:hypothetical protein